jgi:atypical dual specificity phosphatase
MAARAFLYPSLLLNIARERLQEDWHWCDLVAENVMLGAVPFP